MAPRGELHGCGPNRLVSRTLVAEPDAMRARLVLGEPLVQKLSEVGHLVLQPSILSVKFTEVTVDTPGVKLVAA